MAPAIALAIERIVEATSPTSEPEEMAPLLDNTVFARWYLRCPVNPGVMPTREQIRKRLMQDPAIARSMNDPIELQETIASRQRADAVDAGTHLLQAMMENDSQAVHAHAGAVSASWLRQGLHCQSIFGALVGYVLDPEGQRLDSTPDARLRDICTDYASRVPRPHLASVDVDLGASRRRRVPAYSGDTHVEPLDAERGLFRFATTVVAIDPVQAAAVARERFVKVRSLWRSGASELLFDIPEAIRIECEGVEPRDIVVRALRVAKPRVDTSPVWARMDDPDARLVEACEAMTHARDFSLEGRFVDGIRTLWSAIETMVRTADDRNLPLTRISETLRSAFVPYYLQRQFALLGVYLDSAKATKPRLKTPMRAAAILERLRADDFDATVIGPQVYMRFKRELLLEWLNSEEALTAAIADIEYRIETVLFAARAVRNIHTHARVRIASELEEVYIYKWMESLFDAFINKTMSYAKNEGFVMDRHIMRMPDGLRSFRKQLQMGPPYDRLLHPAFQTSVYP